MEESVVNDVVEDAPAAEPTEEQEEFVGAYPEIAAKYKAGEPLTDEELDTVADVALSVLRSILSFFDAADSPIDEYEGDEGELILDVTSSDLAVLIGRHGRTLESLQTLFSLLVSRKLGFRYPVVVDVEGYKARRHDKVVRMAKSAASRAVQQHRAVNMPPMSAYERRLVHITLRDNPKVDTHSEGVDPDRHVVVTPQ